MKTCFKCRAEKSLAEFYAHSKMADGHLGKCKDCTKADAEARRLRKLQDPKWVESERVRHQVKSAKRRKDGLEKPIPSAVSAIYHRRYRARHPEKYTAHLRLARARRKGLIIPQPCFCGEVAQAHHEDYSKPLDVVWLCPKHHAERHIEIRKEQRKSKPEDIK